MNNNNPNLQDDDELEVGIDISMEEAEEVLQFLQNELGIDPTK